MNRRMRRAQQCPCYRCWLRFRWYKVQHDLRLAERKFRAAWMLQAKV